MSFDETMKAIDDQIATFVSPNVNDENRKARKGIGQLANSLYRIITGADITCRGKSVNLLNVEKLYPAVVVYDEGIANHAVRIHLQKKMTGWFEMLGIDHSRVGHVLLFSIRDLELFEVLANPIGAENLMKQYVTHVEQNPNDPHSMFHDYAFTRYQEAQNPLGVTYETIERVLSSVRNEMERRDKKTPND